MKKLCILFLVFTNFIFGQQIKINGVEKLKENSKEYLIIHCVIFNNTNKELILPRTTDRPYNDLSYFFKLKTVPEKSFDTYEHPPLPVGADFYKFNTDDLVFIKPNSSIKIDFDTRKLKGGDLYLKWLKNLGQIQKIKIVYQPFNLNEIQNNLIGKIRNTKIYTEKIESVFYKIPK